LSKSELESLHTIYNEKTIINETGWYETRNGTRAFIGHIDKIKTIKFRCTGYTEHKTITGTARKRSNTWHINGAVEAQGINDLDITKKLNIKVYT